MAITSLLFHSPKPFQHSKPFHNPNRKSFPAKPPTCILKPNNKTSSPYEGHKLQWKEELKIAYGSDQNLENIDKDDAFFQECIDRRAVDNVRMLIVDAVQNAKAGHPGMALGMAEVGYHLYRHVMRYNPKNPKWFNRDRFVLSSGHGCLLQIYEVLFSCLGSDERNTNYAYFLITGPLGQGVANAVGIALAEAHLSARFNKPDAVVVDHRTFCIMGDGCAMEGISNEAAALAAHWRLNKLVVIYDDNKNTIDGDTTLAFSEDISARFKALGWNTINVENVKTLIGKLSRKEGTSKAHHGTFDEDDYQSIRDKVKWNDREPFHVIPLVYREFGYKAEQTENLERNWDATQDYFRRKYPQEAEEFRTLLNGGLPPSWEDSLPVWSMSDAVDATRGYSEKCLNHLMKILPCLIGSSADLASSNKVYLKGYKDFRSHSPEGRNIRYGVREHAMATISNGIARHGSGLIPFAATFLVFSDYMKNAMRLSALSDAGVVYVLTQDSIGLGEDGPTHQPVEHICGLRAIPHMLVFRPADGNETAGAYRVAIRNREAPSVIVLSRQKVAANMEGTSSDGVKTGGYIVSDNSGDGGLPEIILIRTGSELCLCEASGELRNEGRRVRVVSLVCWRLFDVLSKEYKEYVLP
ncbi:hypothetical protein QJS04_geneDACA002098 [Acorus gramineus]|uniref:transketolase n=1 Tax=Acorus gramineus TaxID=55184 RepID=A0AAV9A8A4_ACOGR|nr:hypothetical protein QJS04_geneDACA002098 [Acorus gramineus]